MVLVYAEGGRSRSGELGEPKAGHRPDRARVRRPRRAGRDPRLGRGARLEALPLPQGQGPVRRADSFPVEEVPTAIGSSRWPRRSSPGCARCTRRWSAGRPPTAPWPDKNARCFTKLPSHRGGGAGLNWVTPRNACRCLCGALGPCSSSPWSSSSCLARRRERREQAQPDLARRPGTDSQSARRRCCASTSATRRRSRSCSRGPSAQIEEQGPKLVHALRERPESHDGSRRGTRAKSPTCDRRPNKALVLVDFHVDVNPAVRYTVDELNEILERRSTPPVQATRPVSRPLEGDPGRIDRRLRAQRADRPADPAARPAARLPLAHRALIPLSFGAIT